jgi:hypothetical protein
VPGIGKDGRIEKCDVDLTHWRASTSSTKSVTETDQLVDVVVELGGTRHGMWRAGSRYDVLSIRYYHL